MSIVPMQKVRLLIHATDVDGALDIVQKAGALEFKATEIPDTAQPNHPFPNAALLARVHHAVQFLTPYAPKVGLWKTLREGSQYELTEQDVVKHIKDTDVVSSIVDDLETIQVEFADANEAVRELEETHTLLNNWKELPLKLSELKTVSTATLILENHNADESNTLSAQVDTLCAEADIAFLLTPVSARKVALTVSNEASVLTTTKQLVEEAGVTVVQLPEGVETADVEFVAVSEKLAAARNAVALLYDQAEHFAISHIQTLREANEILTWQQERFLVLDEAVATKYTVVFDGWLNKDKKTAIEAEFAEKSIGASFVEQELEEGEEPPVDIQNSSFIKPFEAVTRLYGMPGYRDLDPTVFLAGFFFLFFGLSLTDVGYGLALMVASGFIVFFCKVTEATKSFAKLLLYIGFATVLVGMLFGGYLGFDPAFLPEWMQALQLFDPIGNPLPVFYLALGLGVFQVMVGMMVSVYSEYRQKRLMTGVLDQGPWLFMFTLGIIYVLTSVGYIDWISAEKISNLALVGVALIVLASGRKGEGIMQKIISSFLGLYAGVAHFSDVLSYSRLLALGLATSALAFAVNLIASMLSEVPYVGFILSAIILVIGHVFTLVINTLGAFVHSARLQFVEFFGKFINGTGKQFAPLTRKETHITVRDE